MEVARIVATQIKVTQYKVDNPIEILQMIDNNQHGYFINEEADMIIHMNGKRPPIVLTEGDYVVHEIINGKSYFEICKEAEFQDKFFQPVF